MYPPDTIISYGRIFLRHRKQGKIRWAKLSRFPRFSGVPRKFFRGYKRLSLIILNNEYLWPRQRKSISVKTSMAFKPRIFSPVNLFPVYDTCHDDIV